MPKRKKTAAKKKKTPAKKLRETERPEEEIQSKPITQESKIYDAPIVERISIPEHLSPIHVDVSNQTAYYSSIEVVPPYDEYCDGTSKDNSRPTWHVHVGDTVIVHSEAAPRQGGFDSTYEWYPYLVPWSPAEVVSLFKRYPRRKCLELRAALDGTNNSEATTDAKVDALFDTKDEGSDHGEEIMMEVRWFYRTGEVPVSKQDNEVSDYEEVFETDHIDTCSTMCLLSPFHLLSDDTNSLERRNLPRLSRSQPDDMPHVIFECRRFWSVRRRALVPVGAASNRIARGRLHSREIQRSYAFQNALLELDQKEGRRLELPQIMPEHLVQGQSSQQSLMDAASTFILSNCATDAHQKGFALRGRETEQRRISNFVRAALRSQNGKTSSTLFCAGPPGTGKTSSIKSVIAQLLQEQALGLLPPFRFVSINAMDLQNPFDAYISLWEAISPGGEKRSASVAAALLESHFGDTAANRPFLKRGEEAPKAPFTVLLLDEIDYLVTKKQTLLYNFFDWPMRGGPNRLIVIGISNTINLPERLHPRVQSRLGVEVCIYRSYTIKEVVDILRGRLVSGNCEMAFDTDALNFAARKTAGYTGDIRKAFQMCRAAAEHVLSELITNTRKAKEVNDCVVHIADIQRATRAMLDSPLIKAISTSTTIEALILVSLSALRSASTHLDPSIGIQDLLVKMRAVANSLGDPCYMPVPSYQELIEMLNRMAESRIVTLITPKSTHVWALVKLPLDDHELHLAFKHSDHKDLADKNLKSRNELFF